MSQLTSQFIFQRLIIFLPEARSWCHVSSLSCCFAFSLPTKLIPFLNPSLLPMHRWGRSARISTNIILCVLPPFLKMHYPLDSMINLMKTKYIQGNQHHIRDLDFNNRCLTCVHATCKICWCKWMIACAKICRLMCKQMFK